MSNAAAGKLGLVIIMLLCAAGVALGVYVGIWVMFIGGIVLIIDTVVSGHINPLSIGLGIGGVFFGVGVCSAISGVSIWGFIISCAHLVAAKP